MYVSVVRKDGVFDGLAEFPDDTKVIPSGHSFSLPPPIPEGYYAVMRGGWKLVEGEKPTWPPPPSPEEIYQSIVDSTQKRLDDFAKTRSYDGILSACTYVTSSVEKFQIEGQYCVNVRDLTWATLYEILAEVTSGARPIPSGFSDIESELPVLVWPDEQVGP